MLQGTLDVFSLDEVLGLLSGANKTGVLNITGDRGVGTVSIAEGLLVDGSASSAPEATALPDALFELLRFEEGSFSFDGHATPEGEPHQLETVMVQANARLSEWKSIEAVVPSLDHQIALVESLATSQVTLSETEWSALVAIGEGATVGVVARRLGLGEFDGSKRVKALVERSLATINEGASHSVNTPVEAAATAVAEPSIIESAHVEPAAEPEIVASVFETPAPAPTSFTALDRTDEVDVEAAAFDSDAAASAHDAGIADESDVEWPAPTDEFDAPGFSDEPLSAITEQEADEFDVAAPTPAEPSGLDSLLPPMPEPPSADDVPPMPPPPVAGDVPPMPEAPSLDEVPPMPAPPSAFGGEAALADEFAPPAPMIPAPSHGDSFAAIEGTEAPASFGGLDPVGSVDMFEAPRRSDGSTEGFGGTGFDAVDDTPPPPAPPAPTPADLESASFAVGEALSGEGESSDEVSSDAESDKSGSLLMRYLKSNG